MEKECLNCHKIYEAKKDTSLFCCAECKTDYYNVEYQCDTCGEWFFTKRHLVEKIKSGERKHLYCDNCTNNGQGSNKVTKICLTCGQPFKVAKAFENIQNYCSMKCSSIGAIKYEDIKCPICGIMFHPKGDYTKYCSYECAHKALEKKVICHCDYCGKEIEKVYNQYIINKKHYCDKTCFYFDIGWSDEDKAVLENMKNKKYKISEIANELSKDYSIKAINSASQRYGFSKTRLWSDEEETIIKNNYSSIPMENLMKLLPERSRLSIIGKARTMNLKSHHYLNYFYTEEDDEYLRNNYLTKSNQELAEYLNVSSPSAIAQHLWKLDLYRPREYDHYKKLNLYIRSSISTWVNRIKEEYKYTCAITGTQSKIVLHHCRSFNLLIKEVIEDLNFEIKESMEDYTQEELDEFLEYFLFLQDYYKEYVCINEDIHRLFHKHYGYGDNTMEQWNDFVAKYKQGIIKLEE